MPEWLFLFIKKYHFMENLKIAIIGYGSMGKEVEKAALANKFEITNIFDIDNKISSFEKYEFDVAIDFSLPDAVLSNIQTLAKLNKNCVIGTTGWFAKFEEIKNIVNNSEIGCVYGSNFSIGMNYFFKIIEYSSKLLNKIDGYDIMLHEVHHNRKKDSPSGTANTLADIILKEYSKKDSINPDKIEGKILENQLHVSSSRVGEVTGFHTVWIDSLADTIELTHRAKNRSGFALGALEAAKWINNKKGFFDFKDCLENILKIE
jgi:4-hydroxy-tetrahydrodipicolinate reductase